MFKRVVLPIAGGAVVAAIALLALVLLLNSLKSSPQQLTAASQGTSAASASAATTGTAGSPAKGTQKPRDGSIAPSSGAAAAPIAAPDPVKTVLRTVTKTEKNQVNGKTVTVTVTATAVVTESAAATVTATPSASAASSAPAAATAAAATSASAKCPYPAHPQDAQQIAACQAEGLFLNPTPTPTSTATTVATPPGPLVTMPDTCTDADVTGDVVAHDASGELLICQAGYWASVDAPNLIEDGQSCSEAQLGELASSIGGEELECRATEPAPDIQAWVVVSS